MRSRAAAVLSGSLALVLHAQGSRAQGQGQDDQDKLSSPTPGWGLNFAGRTSAFLAANPPLPMLYQGQGRWKVTVKPYLFKTEIDPVANRDKWGDESTGKFEGWAFAGGASRGRSERWGYYGWGIGSRGKGDMRETLSQSGGIYSTTELKDIDSTFIMAGVGMTRQFFGRREGGFVLPVFFGPTMTYLSFTQRILLRRRPSDPQAGQVIFDADMKGAGFYPGFMTGAQAGIPLGRAFKFNPYFIFSLAGITKDFKFEMKDYEVSTPRVNLDPTDAVVSDLTARKTPEIIAGFASLGANLTYEPWGLSANITGPLAANLIGIAREVKVTQFSLSWSFGDYAK